MGLYWSCAKRFQDYITRIVTNRSLSCVPNLYRNTSKSLALKEFSAMKTFVIVSVLLCLGKFAVFPFIAFFFMETVENVWLLGFRADEFK